MTALTLPDVKLNYQLLGADPEAGPVPLVMIHGLGANLSFWFLGAVRYLGQERALLLPDLRGHGASSMPPEGYRLDRMAADMLAVMDAAGIGQAHLVGHSHGARVALVLAQRHPERFASLTVADTQLRAIQPPMRLCDWPHWPEWRAQLAEQGVTRFPPEEAEIDFTLLAELGQRGGSALATGELPARAGPARRRGINLRSRQMGARGAQRWQALLETTTARDEMQDETQIDVPALPELPMPVLLAYGAKSHCLPTSEYLLDHLPGARRVVVPGAGHFFPIVKPRVFAMALQAFIGGSDQPAALRLRAAAKRRQRPLRATIRRRGWR
ncbi:alpha/beta hydrolase [Roseivivax sp. GX 12232]|uniref:alpha/beta fold hydrolase n=1 Tax=Roseivivax sp. GX 12232 TaxID=2900547 RepID=UPI001E4B79E9|nr:alpha/beta hydrolase [Roseivivax sp. GX 12232]MCE0505812.1 alpha/beta hydrolase [Roseivivax sp. GX 12232]